MESSLMSPNEVKAIWLNSSFHSKISVEIIIKNNLYQRGRTFW